MKLIFFTLTFLLLTALIAAGQKPQANTYHTNTYINKFEGTWRWTSGNDTVIIRFAKVRHFFDVPPGYSLDLLVGAHSYVKNGLLIESSMSRFDSMATIDHRLHTLYCFNSEEMDTAIVEGYFTDLSKHKRGVLLLEYNATGLTPQLIWKLENTKGLVVTPANQPFDYTFTLPRNIILTKQ